MAAILNNECGKCKQNVNLWTILSSLCLSLFKGIIGILGSSEALAADGLYSFYQSYIAIKATWFKAPDTGSGVKPGADAEKERSALWFAGLVVSAILLFGSIDIVFFSFIRILKASRGLLFRPSPYALSAAVLSILANQLLLKYSVCGGYRNNNPGSAGAQTDSRCGQGGKTDTYRNSLNDSLQLSIIISCISLIGICFARYVSLYGDAISALIVISIVVYKAAKLLEVSIASPCARVRQCGARDISF